MPRRPVRLLLTTVLLAGMGGACAGGATASVSGQHTIRPGATIPADFFPDARGMFRKGKTLPLRYAIVYRRAVVKRQTHTQLKCPSRYRMTSLATDRYELAFIVDQADRKYRGRLRTVRMNVYPGDVTGGSGSATGSTGQEGSSGATARGRILGLCFRKS